MLTRNDFRIYQHGMYDRAMNPLASDTRNMALWAGMGAGKTVVGLTVAEDMLRYRECSKVLVVSTKKAAEYTWATEHEEWEHLQHQKDYTTLLFGNPTQRAEKINKGAVHIINQENLPWLVKGFGTSWPYDLILIDDCKGLKKPRAQTFTNLRRILPYTVKILVLNGTPMPNGYIQLWPQVFLLDKGKRLGKTFGEYQKKFFYPDYNGWNWNLKDGAKDTILSELSDIAYSIDPADYLELQVPEDVIHLVHLPKQLKQKYKELEKEYLLTLDSDQEVEALSEAILQNKLAQFCNGALYTDPLDPGGEYAVVHDLKISALKEIVSELAGENVIVAYNYDSDFQRIKKVFKNVVHANDPDAIKRWNKGEVPILACHPGSAGHGLNLHYGGRTIIWFGSEWSLELNQQMDERIGAVRQAQSGLNKTPLYIRIAVADSIEQRIAAALQVKVNDQNELKEHTRLKT